MKRRLVKGLCVGCAAVLAAGAFAGCGGSGEINGSETALVINEESIPLGEMNLFLRYQQAATYYYMQNLGLSSGSLWDSEYSYDEPDAVQEDTAASSSSSDEASISSSTSSSSSSSTSESSVPQITTTYGEYFKTMIIEDMSEYVVIRQKASEYGCELSEDEQNAINEAAAQFMADNPDAESEFGVTEEMVVDLLELYTYKSDMKPLVTEDVDREVSDEEAAQSTMLYIRIGKNDDDTATNDDGLTNADLLAESEEVLAQIKEAGDIDKDKANEIADAVDDAFFALEYSYGKDDTTFDDKVYEALDSIGDGEVYDSVIDTGDFYYIVKKIADFDREATDEEKESIISTRETEMYDETVDSWVDESDIEIKKCWNDLKLSDNEIYNKGVKTDTSETSGSSSSVSETSAASGSSSSGSAAE